MHTGATTLLGAPGMNDNERFTTMDGKVPYDVSDPVNKENVVFVVIAQASAADKHIHLRVNEQLPTQTSENPETSRNRQERQTKNSAARVICGPTMMTRCTRH